MRIFRSHTWALIALSTALPSLRAMALPSAEAYQDIVSLSEGKPNAASADAPIAFKDTDDPNVVYVPFDQVYLTPKGGDDQRDRFGLVYDDKGGLLNATLRAGYSTSRQAYINKLLQKGLKPTALPIISGGWTFSLTDKKSQTIMAGVDSESTILPDTDVAMSMLLSPEAIRYVVASYNTGAGLGVNYNYTFRAAVTPMRMKASVNWMSVQNFIQNETKVAVHTEAATSGFFGLFSGKAAVSTVVDIRNVAKTAIERQYVKINIVGGGANMSQGDRDARIIDEVTKVILAKTFKPMDSSWAPRDLNLPEAKCDAGNPIFGVSFCLSASVGYLYNAESDVEDRYVEYNIISQDIVNLPGAVGSNFSYLCKDHPELFHNIGTGDDGCPTVWTADGKILTEGHNGAPAAILPAANGNEPNKVSLDKPVTH